MNIISQHLKLFVLYFHTLKYVKFSQIVFRFINFFEIKTVSKKIPPLKIIKSKNWINIASGRKELTQIHYFLFLNKERFVNTNTWKTKESNKLWVYNLHYFNFLNTSEYKKIYKNEDLIEKWIDSTKFFKGVGWERYPTSIRVVNWIKWFFSGNKMTTKSLNSLYIQSRWIFKNPERHLLGNHYFSNLKALVFASCIFETEESKRWLKWSQIHMNKQLNEQILKDGGHFERSPMYHALFLEDILDLINLANASNKIDQMLKFNLLSYLPKMMCWLKNMIHPDGEISFFNDASLGVAKKYSDLESYAKKLNIDIFWPKIENKKLMLKGLLHSGYIRLQSKQAVVILDVASLGPDYLPAHGHADTLSFELSILKQRVIVNGGTSYYGNNNKRLAERKTFSHSTVEINGKDSSQVWSNFRVAKRAYPEGLKIKEQVDRINITCTHSGYAKQGIKVWPIRNWQFKTNQLEILDVIKGNCESAVSRFIFHPSIKVFKKSKTKFQIVLKSKKIVHIILFDCKGQIVKAKYGEEFGKTLNTKCLIIKTTKLSRCQFTW